MVDMAKSSAFALVMFHEIVAASAACYTLEPEAYAKDETEYCAEDDGPDAV